MIYLIFIITCLRDRQVTTEYVDRYLKKGYKRLQNQKLNARNKKRGGSIFLLKLM